MMGQSVVTSDSTLDNRMFIYEVEGLHQNDQTYLSVSPIRESGGRLFSVPHSRMSAFMQRMNRLGGKIVAIHDSWEAAIEKEAMLTKEKDPSSET